MSGGYFEYQQYRISQIADDVQLLIDNNNSAELNSYGEAIGRNYPPEVIERFREAVVALKTAFVYAQRIDWLVSDDDGVNSFLIRLEQELKQLNSKEHDNDIF